MKALLTIVAVLIFSGTADAHWRTHFTRVAAVQPVAACGLQTQAVVHYHEPVTYAAPVYAAPVAVVAPRRVRFHSPPARYVAPPIALPTTRARGCFSINGYRVCQ